MNQLSKKFKYKKTGVPAFALKIPSLGWVWINKGFEPDKFFATFTELKKYANSKNFKEEL